MMTWNVERGFDGCRGCQGDDITDFNQRSILSEQIEISVQYHVYSDTVDYYTVLVFEIDCYASPSITSYTGIIGQRIYDTERFNIKH